MLKRKHKSGKTGEVTPALMREDGNIAVLAAGLLSFLTATTVVSVDAGSMHYKQKQLQRIADEAALAATLAPDRGYEVALASLASNGLTEDALKSVRVGNYNPMSAQNRFTPNSGSNAVEITLNNRVALSFLPLLGGADHVNISASAVAANIPEVGFSARSGLLDFALTNGLLSSVSGSKYSLSNAEYAALSNGRINIIALLEEIALLMGSNASNFADLLEERVSASTVFAALYQLLLKDSSADPAALAALDGLASGKGFGNLYFDLNQLVELSSLAARAVGEGGRRTDAADGFRVIDVIISTVHVAGRGRVLDIGNTPGIPGIYRGRIYVELDDGALDGSGAGGAPLVVGPAGSSLHTSAGRVLFDLQLLGGEGLDIGSELKLPVYVELGSGDVALTSVSCGTDPSTDTTMTFTASASFGRAYIADIDLDDMRSGREIVDPEPVDILKIGSLTASGYAELNVLGSGGQQVSFDMNDIIAGNTAVVGDEEITESLIGSLFDNLYIDIYESGSGGPKSKGKGNDKGNGGLTGVTEQVVERNVRHIVSGMSRRLDPLISGVLESLGLRAGYTELGPTDVRCGTPVIVS